jgi:hypothetical protein
VIAAIQGVRCKYVYVDRVLMKESLVRYRHGARVVLAAVETRGIIQIPNLAANVEIKLLANVTYLDIWQQNKHVVFVRIAKDVVVLCRQICI